MDSSEQIGRLAEIFGGKEIVDYAEKKAVKMPRSITAKIAGKRRKAWHKIIPENGVATDLALDLLDRMLTVEYSQSISAADALNHPFSHTRAGSPLAISRCLLRADKGH
jgi:serine/threonine protein kinase